MQVSKRRKWRRIGFITGIILLLFFSGILVLANFYIEPVLRKRLHTLIIDGSDSLYTYKLESLNANVFGGNIEVKGLHVSIDSNHYHLLKSKNALPALVMQLDIERASIKGIGIFSLLFSKKIFIEEISSKEANIKLLRNFKKLDSAASITKNKQPLWKTLRPNINDISINKIQLEGIKLLYRNTEEIDAAKLQFDRCDAIFENIRIDSASIADTSRIGYVENFSFRLNDLKFRTPDSAYKLKAEWIAYNSSQRLLQIDSFKLQPTVEKEERIDSLRKSWYTIIFDKVDFVGLRLDRYLRFNRAEADSVVFQNPKIFIFQDKQGLKTYRSKIGHYPHQELLNADAIIDIKKFIAHNMQVEVKEKQEESREEGTIALNNLEIAVENIVNDPALIRQNPVITATASGKIIGSPVQVNFRFFLDSAGGRFDAKGNLQNVTAVQVNPLSTALANVEVPSANIQRIDFFMRGDDFGALADVQMKYDNLSVVFLKRNKETGNNTTRKFLTDLLNKYAIYNSNPAGGIERQATGIRVARLTTQSFFGIIWQAVFAGMQNIMLKT